MKSKIRSSQNAISANRTIRIFLSSTFRDFGEERDLLVRRVFPGLRARLKDRFVEIVDVDLRWGITAEQAERGEVLPICLVEIDRSRPYFVGMLGERYGWVPPADAYAPDLIERQPWLKKHRGGKSVTELEILHGVLNNPKMAGQAFFYVRSAAYAKKKGGEYLPASKEDAERQQALKARIRENRFPVVHYRDPEAFAKRLERDLWKVIDEAFPADSVPDAFEREARRHEAYAAPRRRLYLGGARYLKALDAAMVRNIPRILVEGASGGGKSALLANWLAAHRKAHPKDFVHEHYLGASADAADPVALVRRLIEAIQRTTGSTEEIPGDPQKLLECLPLWLATASAYAGKRRTRWVIVLDALNSLTDLRDLRWLPAFLPARVHIVISWLPGEVRQALNSKGNWKTILVKPLIGSERKQLLVAFLARYKKTLPHSLLKRALAHPLAANPLFLRTLGEELRIFGVHEELEARLGYYLKSKTVDNLFERVLERVEGDCGEKLVRTAMQAIWASRVGLTEEEILGLTWLVPATWAPIRHALDEALLESSGRLTFAHDYLRIGVRNRYLPNDEYQKQIHITLAKWFAKRPADARRVEEEPHQWRKAKAWKPLKACLLDKAMFEAFQEHRSNEELLGYWLDLERDAKADIEKDYAIAWANRKPAKSKKETGDQAGQLERFLRFAGRYGAFTERMATLSLEINERLLGPEHPDTGTSLNNLAVLLQNKGQYAVAEPLYRRALAIAEKTQGPEHSETGTRLNNLALLLKTEGDYDAADPLYRRALAIAESVQGPEHPETGSRLANLAALLRAKGDYDAAEPLYRRALAIAEKTLGPEHPETGLMLANLALLLKTKGDYDAANPLYRRALAIAESVQGPEHPETGSRLVNLAALLYAKGDYDAAEPLVQRALSIKEKMLGSEHPEIGTTLNNLALLLKAKGDYGAAEPLYRRALAITEKAQGPEHPHTGIRLNNLALLLQAKDDYDAAEPLHRRALAIAEKAQGPEHPETGARLNNLALLLEAKGDHDAAEPLYRRALAITEKALGPGHPETGAILYGLGQVLIAQGRLSEAEDMLQREITIVRKREGGEAPSLVTSLQHLGVALRDAGQLDKAEAYLLEALEIAERIYADERLSLAPMLSAVGQLRFLQERHAEARELLARCLKIRKEGLPEGDERIVQVEARLAEVERTIRLAGTE